MYFPGSTPLQIKGSLFCCLHFSFESIESTSLWPRCQNVGLEALGRNQPYISAFDESCRCFLQHFSLAVSLWRGTYSLGNHVGCLGVPVRPSLSNISTNIEGKASSVDGDSTMGLCIPYLSILHEHFLHIHIYFMKVLLYWVSMLSLQCPLILVVLICISSTTPSPPSLLDSPIPVSTPFIHIYLFHIPFLINICFLYPLSYTYPNQPCGLQLAYHCLIADIHV